MSVCQTCFANIIDKNVSEAIILKENISAKVTTPASEIKINYQKIFANILYKSSDKFQYCNATIIDRKMSAKIINLVVLSGGENMPDLIINFSQGDIQNGKLRRVHNFNKSVVDVSIFDNLNNEVMVGLEIIDVNTVELDFSRVAITGNWRLLIER